MAFKAKGVRHMGGTNETNSTSLKEGKGAQNTGARLREKTSTPSAAKEITSIQTTKDPLLPTHSRNPKRHPEMSAAERNIGQRASTEFGD